VVDVTTFSPGVQQALGAQDVDRESAMQAFGRAIATLRDEAVRARQTSGIETLWMKYEEAYLGIDDSNRSQFGGARWAKPNTMAAPVTSDSGGKGDPTRSTAYVRLTSRYVDAGAAKIGEITDPVDDKPFKLDPTPVPDLIEGKEDKRQVMRDGQPIMRKPGPDDMPEPDMMGGPSPEPPESVPLTVADLARFESEKAEKAADKAATRIYDWLVECKHSVQMEKVREDMARIGTGVLKGPVPETVKAKAVVLDEATGTVSLKMVKKTVPVTRWVDPWNLFPFEDCGENIHDGGGVFERDFLSPASLRRLKGQPNYVSHLIDRVLEEGPDKALVESANPGQRNKDIARKRFTVWYFYGEVSRSDVASFNPELHGQLAARENDDEKEPVFAIVTMVNDTVIKLVQNPLETGSFPYHVGRWRRRSGSWTGVGVAEQLDVPQAIVNGSTRAMLNNGGQSAGVVTVVNRKMLEPMDSGGWTMTPGKMFGTVEGDDGITDDVRKAFAFFTVPNVTGPIMSIAEYGFKLAEESTNIPLISQGQSGKTTPDTFGGQQLQDNNANQLLRAVGKGIANDITNPLVDMMYEWLLLDPEVPKEEKGDFQVNTNAAAAMIERAIQDITIMQMGAMVVNPVFKKSPQRWFDAMCRTKRIDPREFDLTEEEKREMAQGQQPPPPIAVAQINAASREKVAQSHDQATVAKMKADTDRDQVYVAAETERTRAESEGRMAELTIKRELALLDYANKRNITLDKVKADLAQTAMELNLQRELSGKDGKGPQVADPAIEPAGRAPEGEAFQR